MHKMLTYYRQFRNGDLDPDPHEEKASYARIPEAKKPKSSHVTFNFYYTYILYYYILYILLYYTFIASNAKNQNQRVSLAPRGLQCGSSLGSGSIRIRTHVCGTTHVTSLFQSMQDQLCVNVSGECPVQAVLIEMFKHFYNNYL